MSSDRELDETYRILLDVWKREITLPTLLKIESMERFIPRIKTLLQHLNDKYHHSSNPVFKQILLEYIDRVKYLMEDIFETRFKKILHHTQNNLPIEEDSMFPFENECYKSINLGFKGYSMAKNFVLSPEQKHIGQFIKPNENLLNAIQNGMANAVTPLPENETPEESEALLELEDENTAPASQIEENQSRSAEGASNEESTSPNIEFNQEVSAPESQPPLIDQNELTPIDGPQSLSNQGIEEPEIVAPSEDIFSELNSIPEPPENNEIIEPASTSKPDEAKISENKTLDVPKTAIAQESVQSGNEEPSVEPLLPAVEQNTEQKSELPPAKSANLSIRTIPLEFDSSIEYSVIRILSDVPELVGEDLRIYGPFCPQDVVSIPKSNADIIISQRKAEIIKPII